MSLNCWNMLCTAPSVGRTSPHQRLWKGTSGCTKVYPTRNVRNVGNIWQVVTWLTCIRPPVAVRTFCTIARHVVKDIIPNRPWFSTWRSTVLQPVKRSAPVLTARWCSRPWGSMRQVTGGPSNAQWKTALLCSACLSTTIIISGRSMALMPEDIRLSRPCCHLQA